jgi:hypothetical protein
VDFIKDNCVAVAVAVDNYVPGNSAETAFVRRAVQGVNQAFLVTANGQHLGGFQFNSFNTMPEGLKKFKQLPETERKPSIEKPAKVTFERSPATPPAGGLVAICYWTYLDRDDQGALSRAKKAFADAYYGSILPVAPAYTDCEMFWLTAQELKSLVPAKAQRGATFPLPATIQERITKFYAFDFRARDRQPARHVRAAELTLTVGDVSADRIDLSLVGHIKTGVAFEKYQADPPAKLGDGTAFANDDVSKAGCDLTFSGRLEYDVRKQLFTRFDIVAVGDAWGEGTNRYRGAGKNAEPRRWPLGLAFELVTGNRPIDRIPPFAASRYSTWKYFGEK